jgi:hypothetical protein
VATTAYRLALQSDEVKESNVDYPLCFENFFLKKKTKTLNLRQLLRKFKKLSI